MAVAGDQSRIRVRGSLALPHTRSVVRAHRKGRLELGDAVQGRGPGFAYDHGADCSAYGADCSAYGADCSAYGADCSAYGADCSAYGADCSAYGADCSAYGAHYSAY